MASLHLQIPDITKGMEIPAQVDRQKPWEARPSPSAPTQCVDAGGSVRNEKSQSERLAPPGCGVTH